MHKFLVGSTKEGLNLKAHTVQEIAEIFMNRRKTAKKRKLRWRVSSGSKKSLGWIPFKTGTLKLKKGFIWYGKYKFKVWDSYGLENYNLGTGSFNQDSRGNWYLNITVDTESIHSKGDKEIGIDLGLKSLAAISNGKIIENPKFYARLEGRIAKAQKARKKKQIRNLYAKIKNQRKDYLHKVSTKLVEESKLIIVGDVNSAGLAKTHLSKGVNDAGWGMFKTMLEYKAIRQQVKFIIVNESFTTQTCSVCNSRTGPKGLEGLGIREWTCIECGSVHDRDINSAKNILALGHQRLAEGVLA